MRIWGMLAITLLIASCEQPEEQAREGLTDGGSYYLYWDAVPSSIPFNEPFKLSAMVHDGEDPTQMHMDKELFVEATMPQHGHGMDTVPNVTMDNGVYTIEGMLFHMAGDWELVFAVSDGETVERATFNIDCCES